jgi:Na+-transporting methylmalonyl-CoA/oxaloacetate decarboxylase gamma subunit
MSALKDFVSTDYGLLSLVVIAFMIGMGAFFVRFFTKHIAEDAARAAAAERKG